MQSLEVQIPQVELERELERKNIEGYLRVAEQQREAKAAKIKKLQESGLSEVEIKLAIEAITGKKAINYASII